MLQAVQPYFFPLAEFQSKKFKANFGSQWARIQGSLNSGLVSQTNGGWCFLQSEKTQRAFESPKKRDWLPKVYVCLKSDSYWKGIKKLIFLCEQSELRLKFCIDSSLAARPDKIVLYFRNAHQLTKLLPRLRNSLRGLSFHKLNHAASPYEMKMGPMAKGLFIGTDPVFLKTSWRHYRVEVLRFLSEDLSREKKSTVLELLNLSPKHQGPFRLCPRTKKTQKIKKFWIQKRRPFNGSQIF